MAAISRSSIKALLKRKFGVNITESGADELARILEDEAKKIASAAVTNARKDKRDKVTRSDIKEYVIKGR